MIFRLCLLATAALTTTFAGEPASSAGKQPLRNAIWVVLDACRYDHLSCYGYGRATSPNLDKMAERGALFEQCHAQGFNTLASVPSYMTGRLYPVSCLETGDWRDMFRVAPPAEFLIPSVMSRALGYL